MKGIDVSLFLNFTSDLATIIFQKLSCEPKICWWQWSPHRQTYKNNWNFRFLGNYIIISIFDFVAKPIIFWIPFMCRAEIPRFFMFIFLKIVNIKKYMLYWKNEAYTSCSVVMYMIMTFKFSRIFLDSPEYFWMFNHLDFWCIFIREQSLHKDEGYTSGSHRFSVWTLAWGNPQEHLVTELMAQWFSFCAKSSYQNSVHYQREQASFVAYNCIW